jgi:hypothetical protein
MRCIRRINCIISRTSFIKRFVIYSSFIIIALHFYFRSLCVSRRPPPIVYEPIKLTKSKFIRVPSINHPRPVLKETIIRIEFDNDQNTKDETNEIDNSRSLFSKPKKAYDLFINLIKGDYNSKIKEVVDKEISNIMEEISAMREDGFCHYAERKFFGFLIRVGMKVKNIFAIKSKENEEKGLLATLGIYLVMKVVKEDAPANEGSSNIIMRGVSGLFNIKEGVSGLCNVKERVLALSNIVKNVVSGLDNIIQKGFNTLVNLFCREEESREDNKIDLNNSTDSVVIEKSRDVEEESLNDLPRFENMAQEGFYALRNFENVRRDLFTSQVYYENAEEESLDKDFKSDFFVSTEVDFVSCEEIPTSLAGVVSDNQDLDEEWHEVESELYYDTISCQ